jgi:small conductance mechanosensitive channel
MRFESELQVFLISAGLHIAGAVAVLLLGRWVARLLQRSVRGLLKRTAVSHALSEIINRVVYYTVLLIATFSALVILGIPANILLGVLGILVVVAAVALRESLRDLAATVIFVIFQPFKVGDTIETNGVTGTVKEVLLFQTILITRDNRQTIIPNGSIQNSAMVNLSVLPANRLDLTVHLSYADDIHAAKASLLKVANSDPRVHQDPAPCVDVMDLGVGQVKYVLRVYATPLDVLVLQSALNEQIKLLMEQSQLAAPLPQLQLDTGRNLLLSSSD